MPRNSYTTLIYPGLFCLLVVLSIATLMIGDTPWNIVWHDVVDRVFQVSHQWNPLLDERAPRLIVLLCTGASLAVSGAVMQALFQNPLASPGVLGVTAGGSLCVLFIILSGFHIAYPFLIPIGAVGGCFFTMLLVYGLAKHHGGGLMTTIILTGIAISVVFMSVQGALLYSLRENWHLIQLITEWEAGSTADRTWQHVHMQFPLTLVGLWGCWRYRQEINMLTLGEDEARNLGVEVDKVRWRLFLCVSLLTGGALAGLGMIAFFGLILPNMIRKIKGPDHRSVIPIAMVGGSVILLALDLGLRIFAVHAFSIGNLSAILGGAFFLFILFGSRRESIC